MQTSETHIPARSTTGPHVVSIILSTAGRLVHPAFLQYAHNFLKGYIKTCYK